MASAAMPPISLASWQTTTSIYVLAVKRSAPEAISAPAATRLGRGDVAGLALVHDHDGDDRIEPLGHDRRDVVGDDALARGHLVALADVRGEALALQRDGVQTEVDQDADVVGGHDDVGVRQQLQELAADRGDAPRRPRAAGSTAAP